MNDVRVLVVRSDGAFLSPEQAPTGWLRGDRLAERAPAVVRRAVDEAGSRASAEGASAVAIVDDGPDAGTYVVVVVDAVPLRRAVVAVDELVGRTMDVFASQTRGGRVALVVEVRPDVPPAVHVDGEKLGWALATLVGNALRALGAGEGTITLRVAYASKTIVLAVEDDGPGMPAETARWLFDRDPRTGRTAPLALRLVRDVCAAHGGSTEVRSAPGEGTTVTLRIPSQRPARG